MSRAPQSDSPPRVCVRAAALALANRLPRVARRVPFVVLSLVALALAAQSASAQTVLYQIRGNATAGSNKIWALNPTTGAESVVLDPYPGGNAATLAQRPSDGMLFFAINNGSGINGAVYRFNPATPNVAPTLLGNIGPAAGVNVSSGFRMAFSPAGTLYYMVGNSGAADPNTLYTVDQNTGRATKLTTITGTTDGGDMAFDSAGTIYIVDQNRILYTASTAGGGANTVGTINFGAATVNTIGIAFDSTGRLLLQTVSNTNGGQLWSVSGTTASLIATISGGGTATGDMASAAVPDPTLSITKTDNVSSVYRGGSLSYVVTVTNNGTYPVTGTVTDTVPATITLTGNWTCVASAGSLCTAASGAGNNINTSAMLLAGGTATYTINGTLAANATGTLTNTARVAVPVWLTDSNTANNVATDNDTINLNTNLGITKTDGLANVNPGATVTYTVVVSNAGPDVANGAIVTDTVPAALSGVAWTCGNTTGGATCGAASGSGNNISTTANLPSGGTVRYTITGTLSTSATGTLSNTAQVAAPSGATDPTPANNSATDTTTINLVADPSITKTHTGNFTRGSIGAYAITVTNSGTGPTSGTVTVTDTLPAGLTPTAPTGTVNGWSCLISTQTVTCTRSDALAAGLSYPVINVTVNVLQTAASSVTNTATVSGGGGNISTSNDSASDPTTIVSSADLSLTKTVNNATPIINTNVTFTVTVSNAGPSNATGIAVTDLLPAGLTLVTATPSAGTSYNSVTGVWTIGNLASGGASPTLQLLVKVTASGTITNTAQVTAATEPDPDSTPNNNAAAEDDQASATLNVPAPPAITLCKTFPGQTCTPAPSLPVQPPGADITYVIIFTNTGGSAAQGLTITDVLPTSTDFKVGSMIANLGSTGLSVTFYYSYDGTTFTNLVLPTSGGGSAPAGYDRTVKAVRWVFTGNLSQNPTFNTGDVRFTARIR